MSNLLLSLISICMVVDRWQPQFLPAQPATFGYVDRKGREVIAPKYARADAFKNGYARCVRFDEKGHPDWSKFVFIDKTGNEFVVDEEIPLISSEGEKIVSVGMKRIKTTGDYTVLCKRNGMLLVRNTYDIFVIDKTGKRFDLHARELYFGAVNPKSGNWFCIKDGKSYEFTGRGKFGEIPGIEPAEPSKFISRQSSTAGDTMPNYDYFGPYTDGMISAWSRKNGWSFLDKNGKVRIKLPPECCSAQPFSEGLAAVAVGGKPWKDNNGQSDLSPLKGAKFGFIDKTGKFVIPPRYPCPRYKWQSKFENGLALATVEKNSSTAFGYINKQGRFVVPAKYSQLGEFSEGLASFNSSEPGFAELATRQRSVSDNTIQQFLRQYEIFAMNRSDVEKLLGEPTTTKEHPKAERYLVQLSCLGSTYFNIRYKPDGMVAAYSITTVDVFDPNNPFPPSDWIMSEQKPEVDEDLWSFFTRASKVTYSPASESEVR